MIPENPKKPINESVVISELIMYNYELYFSCQDMWSNQTFISKIEADLKQIWISMSTISKCLGLIVYVFYSFYH